MIERLKRFSAAQWPLLALVPPAFILAFRYVRWEHSFDAAYIAFFSDDLFYYLEIAQHILSTGVSTFDGITVTNGYHPLWMEYILGLGRLSGGLNETFFLMFRCSLIVLTFWSGYILFELCSRFIHDRAWKFAVFLYSGYFTCRLAFAGMEVALAIPLLLLFVRAILEALPGPSLRSSLTVGLLGAFAVLSRLDSILFVVPVLTLILLSKTPGKRMWAVSLAIVVVPFAAYSALNSVVFDSWLPVSGVAKQLKKTILPSPMVLESLFVPRAYGKVFSRILPLCVSLAGLGLVVFRRKRRDVEDIVVAWSAVFPVVFFSILLLRYDWLIDDWYFYSVPISIVMSARLIKEFLEQHHRLKKTIVRSGRFVAALVITYVLVSLFRSWNVGPETMSWYMPGIAVRDFSREHPGVYAMGDRAGLAAFLSDAPIIHLEGLAADRDMVDYIARQDHLIDVLDHYGVAYYVATDWTNEGGCFAVREPAVAGTQSPTMSAVLCRMPVYETHFKNGTGLAVFQMKPR